MRGWQTIPTASAMSPQVQQEFAIPLGAHDRRGNLTGNLVAGPLREFPNVDEDLAVLVGVPYDATLSHRALANLELRLDQRHHLARRTEEVADARQHQPQGDERDIDHREVRRDRQPIQMPDVDPLQHGDPRVLTKAKVQLSITDVDRDHPRGASLQ